MTATTLSTKTPPLFDKERLAVAGFLARYSGPTRRSYATDLRPFFTWCAHVELQVFELKRGHIELWARAMEDRGFAAPRSVGDCPRSPASTAWRS